VTIIRVTGCFMPGEEATVGRMCWITPDLAGKELTTSVSAHTVHLSFPPRDSEDIVQPGYNGVRGDDRSNPVAVSPLYFTAWLDWDVEGTGESTEDKVSLKDAVDVLRAAATRLTDGIRLSQPHSGLAGDLPVAQSLSAVILASGQALPRPVPLNPGHPGALGYPPFDSATVERALSGGIRTPELLLAQASYWATWTQNPKPGLAVMLTAMACESRIRQVLVERVNSEAAPLLKVLLDKPQVFQSPAHDLFDHVAKAVLGRSLREDNPVVWAQLRKVFQLRNKMAHSGIEPPQSDVGPLAFAGYKVFDWIGYGD
jgi:hypothetical protein